MLALALAAALVPTTLAQQLPPTAPGVTVAFDGEGASVGSGNVTTTNVTVTNTGPAAGTVALALTVPTGWTAQLDGESIQLAAGASAVALVTITAPVGEPGVPDDGTLGVTATLTEANTNRQATASATYALSLIPLPLPPPPTPFFQTPLGIATILSALALVVGAAAFVLARKRRLEREAAERAAAEKAAREAYLARETGIGIIVMDGPTSYGQRRELAWRIAVENRSDRPRVGLVEVVDVPKGWRAAPSLPKIPLSPGQRTVLTVVVTPEPETPAGQEIAVVVRAKPEEALELDERVTLDAVAPSAPAPLREEYKPVVVQRLGANQQPAPKK